MNGIKFALNLLGAGAVGLAFCVNDAEALENNGGYTFSNVTVRQRWPWSRKVDIDFFLAKPEGASSSDGVAIGLTASNGANAVTISDASIYGDTDYMAPEGYRRIVWDPTVEHTGESFSQLKFYLSVTSTNPTPTYMIVDAASGAIEYRGKTFADVVNTDTYKTNKMVLRLVPAGSFLMGNEGSGVSVTLTKGFYIGIFPVTQRQYELVKGTKPSYYNNATYYATRPVEKVSYDLIRGTVNGTNWPASGAVDSTSFMGVLRDRTNLDTFDLPTDAQFEYACRAGTTTLFNDGDPTANLTSPNDKTNAWLNALGRYKFDGGFIDGVTDPPQSCTPTNATATVGSYKSNAWGLYDMHGNVWEWCLDWFGTVSGGSNPSGPTTGSQRVMRNGCYDQTPASCRSSARNASGASAVSQKIGFRVVCNLP